MRKIAITQRVDKNNTYEEYRDSLDQNWSLILNELNLLAVPIPNNLINLTEWINSLKIDGVILSGGNDLGLTGSENNISKNRDRTETNLLNYLKNTDIPVLGVCRGMQFINCFHEGKISKINNHAGVNHHIFLNKDNSQLNDIGYSIKESVNSFHNWGIKPKELSKILMPLAIDEKENIEAFKHKYLNWWGIMWHPERQNKNDNDLKLINHIFNLD